MVIMESTLFDGKILFLKPSSTLFNILRLAAQLTIKPLQHCKFGFFYFGKPRGISWMYAEGKSSLIIKYIHFENKSKSYKT